MSSTFSDRLNEFYYECLLRQRNSTAPETQLYITKDLYHPHRAGKKFITPTALLENENFAHLPLKQFSDIKDNSDFIQLANETSLLFWPMQAGTGSSIKRANFLQKLGRTKLGPKGTDLGIEIDGQFVTLAELQIIKCYQLIQKKIYKHIYFQDLVGQETKQPIHEIWNKPSFIDNKDSYETLYAHFPELTHIPTPLFQKAYANIDEAGKTFSERKTPGGHGLFAYMALYLSLFPDEFKILQEEPNLVGIISNGEDLNSFPHPSMVGHMIKNKIPIIMVTTDKTSIDLKGGQIALYQENDQFYITILEKAQAEHAGQEDLFESLGLQLGQNKSYFNTNMALVNYRVLSQKLTKLSKKLGVSKNELLKQIAPDLIKNKKSIPWKDRNKTLYQLEGGMGSLLLNLDKLWRKTFNESLVEFVNIEQQFRMEFFTPIKTAFDFYMLYYSDRFIFDQKEFRPHNAGPIDLPVISLADDYYKEVTNALHSFYNCKIKSLTQLKILGKVKLCGLTLVGSIEIINESDAIFNLGEYITENGLSKELKNVKIKIKPNLKLNIIQN